VPYTCTRAPVAAIPLFDIPRLKLFERALPDDTFEIGVPFGNPSKEVSLSAINMVLSVRRTELLTIHVFDSFRRLFFIG
jgi:hypothetical protein